MREADKMASYTWTKEVCKNCTHTTRTRGKHYTENGLCTNCMQKTMNWTEIHWGPEKYAMGRKGQVTKNTP